jgi:hypothetical protein
VAAGRVGDAPVKSSRAVRDTRHVRAERPRKPVAERDRPWRELRGAILTLYHK